MRNIYLLLSDLMEKFSDYYYWIDYSDNMYYYETWILSSNHDEITFLQKWKKRR